jgi:hypothetical protein
VICSLLLALAAVGTACTSDAAPGVNAADYRAALASLCTASAEDRSVLAPPDDTGVAAFARSVADILTRQADAARALRPPSEIDDDHRAFVQNTADQAGQWTSLATTSPDDAEQFGAIQTAILELTLGRDDLAIEMDVPECRVQVA